MLLRQLQRPLSRSVAAAWRSAPPTALLHGSSSSRLQDESQSQQPQSQSHSPPASATEESPRLPDQQKQNEENKNQKKDKPSLFEQLFPEEAKQPGGASTSSRLSQLFEEPQRIPLHDGFPIEGLQNEENKSAGAVEWDTTALRAKAILILSAASKHLLESDFLRLGPKGKHVEGWVSGILKVIQARDPDTLEPLGHYFILFDSPEAAVYYRDEVERLWQLGKSHVPGAHHKKHSEKRQPVPRGLRTDRGEDILSTLKSFTLVPPSQRYRLALRISAGEQAVSPGSADNNEMYGGGFGDYGLAHSMVEELDRGGAFADQLARRVGSRSLVLLGVEGGRVAADVVRRAISDDGRDRNLPWRVTDLQRGIIPFGKSVLRLRDQDPKSDVLPTGVDPHSWELFGRQVDDEGAAVEAAEQKEREDRYRRYPRFIVAFTDDAEAHRFVRTWHRRELRLRMGDAEGEGGWEETRIVNATVLW
ncbi:Uu.00g048140.m01.CDS01 [Anthostomella pinea]|uniref:Uu.00g048140.m01.CDS01 n=1 Tax=Anthostomella pinea TaxID=933095 RepID=A0AAI8YEK5_9PEZI|nr:Uu.00g048140.m01.CDS01 [Anthostomella pinea]